MKLIAVLLLCVAAAQAQCPGYSYWAEHQFHVYPPTNAYGFQIPFQQCWLTVKYYGHILRAFPKVSGTSCEDEPSPTIDEFVQTEFTSKLSEKRNEMNDELTDGLAVLQQQITDVHAEYLKTFKSYLKRVYSETSTEYCDKVDEYNTALGDLKTAAENRYNNKVSTLIEKIDNFHEKIITDFKNCLNMRKIKIENFDEQINLRQQQTEAVYLTALQKHIAKRECFVRDVFAELYGTKAPEANFNAAMTKYNELLGDEKDDLVEEFNTKITNAVTLAKTAYKCNYKCFFDSGCYGFSGKKYQGACKPIPCAPKYLYKLVKVSPFNPKWTGCPFTGLKDTTNVEEESFVPSTYETCINNKAGEYTNELTPKVQDWKNQVIAWRSTSWTTLQERISHMEPKAEWGKCPTADQITTYQGNLETEAGNWLDAQRDELNNKITTLETKYTNMIDNWKTKALNYISNVNQHFTQCDAERTTKYEQYQTWLTNKICNERTLLKNKLEKLATVHKAAFNRFYEASFGKDPAEVTIQNLKTNYETCVDNKVTHILDNVYDAFWDDWQTKLEDHYKCTFKCLPKVQVPLLRTHFVYKFCPPSLSCWQPSC